MKETINLSYFNEVHYEDFEGFVCVYDEQTGFDGEKGFCDNEVVIMRKSDEKYFKFEYTDYGKGEDDISEQVAVEVEKKSKTVFYYE